MPATACIAVTSALGLLIALILWLSHSLLQHRRMAQTDYLTGIANRGRAFELGFKWCDDARSRGRSLSIVLFDLDRFKRINDGLGHAAGDRALREVVKVVQGILPPGALFARLGGEEFLVVLPEVDRERAMDIAEDMRAAVAASGFLHAGKHPVNVTISLGVAELDESADFQLLVNRADEALYVAKNSGRNRAVAASSTAERLSEGKVTVGSRRATR
jgi:diguanylate cyclase (GGDEF)-like protein